MTDTSSTTTCICKWCNEPFEFPLFDSAGRRRSQGQIDQKVFCSKEHRVEFQKKEQTVRRRLENGHDPSIDARTTRGLADHTIEQIAAVRAFASPSLPVTVLRETSIGACIQALSSSWRGFWS